LSPFGGRKAAAGAVLWETNRAETGQGTASLASKYAIQVIE
jgi:hypothetical protein